MSPKTKQGKAAKRVAEAAGTAPPPKATRRGGRREQASNVNGEHLSDLLAAEHDRAEPPPRQGRAREKSQAPTATRRAAPARRAPQAEDFADKFLYDPEEETPRADKYGDFAPDEQVRLLNLLSLSMCYCDLH